MGLFSKKMKKCGICMEEIKDNVSVPEIGRLKCWKKGHYYCKVCISGHLREEFLNKSKPFFAIGCPYGCKEKLDYKVIPDLCDKETLEEYNNTLKTIPKSFKNQTLDDFNYVYEKDTLKLKHKISGNKFHFIGERHYDDLGDAIINEIQDIMKNKYGMQELWLPEAKKDDVGDDGDKDTDGDKDKDDAKDKVDDKDKDDDKDDKLASKNAKDDDDEKNKFKVSKLAAELVKKYSKKEGMAQTNIFISSNWGETDKFLILCQGSGAVRPPMWARALCLNDSLHTGTMFGYIERAHKRGFSCIVLNPNNSRYIHGIKEKTKMTPAEYYLTPTKAKTIKAEKIKGHTDSNEHAVRCYDALVKDLASGDKPWGIIAHSAGGRNTLSLLRYRVTRNKPENMKAIVFTDSVHSISYSESDEVREILVDRAINYAQSHEPLDTLLAKKGYGGCEERSAGTPSHIMTSFQCTVPAWKFIDKAFDIKDIED